MIVNKKYIEDPVRGQIFLKHNWVVEILNTNEFKRLMNIRQLGYSVLNFPGATHTRYAHSLGTYFLADKVINQLEIKDIKLQNEILAAALLHDLGHGPYSHVFETFVSIDHEEMTCNIILDKKTSINKILTKYKINSNNVVAILKHKHKVSFVNDLISSQIDVDRLDYLTRDSHYTGACYGIVDCDILISWMIKKDNKICFQYDAINSLENFLLGRYHMFAQVYEQPKTMAYESLIRKLLQRFKYVFNQNKAIDYFNMSKFFLPWLKNKDWTIQQYLQLNDSVFTLFIKQMEYEKDEQIRQSIVLLKNWNRNDYSVVVYNKQNEAKIKNLFKNKKTLANLYNHNITTGKNIYHINKQPIYVCNEHHSKIYTLDQLSDVIKTVAKMNIKKQLIVYRNKL